MVSLLLRTREHGAPMATRHWYAHQYQLKTRKIQPNTSKTSKCCNTRSGSTTRGRFDIPGEGNYFDAPRCLARAR